MWGAMRRRLKRQVPTICQVARCSARCVMAERDLEVGDGWRRTDGVPAELSLRFSRRILLYVTILSFSAEISSSSRR
ncbi:hypothetical protein BU25DRAFT_34132 [Macroventuria anomochaeta]|uniref:Uncharacterized protein n=1 Tax=Macroventuria anomochaeta TaxID=301207 RepID=A0ACB6S273_9PLEO|nr:uncharacterized protein BU25DRAFT_34132 [Macroventuria anomochaeta]KAF2628371.1 hypothetical protein BU25DRAFT_34132 [Macroventuria anomochaeta]